MLAQAEWAQALRPYDGFDVPDGNGVLRD